MPHGNAAGEEETSHGCLILICASDDEQADVGCRERDLFLQSSWRSIERRLRDVRDERDAWGAGDLHSEAACNKKDGQDGRG
jgi:hypothetical protein